MTQIKFDKSKKYYDSKLNKYYGQGIWFKDTNDDGKYNEGESLIPMGNRIKNSNNSYVQLNSDGSRTLLYSKGKFTNTNISNVDKQAISKGLIYGHNASLQNNKYVRSNNGISNWDIDTVRQKNKDGSYTDINNNTSFIYNKNKYIGTAGSKNVIDLYHNVVSNDGGKTWSRNSTTQKSVSPFITRRYGTQPLGQYLNPDTNIKTNYAEVNFGDTNGQNQYLKNNYWVYDDGNGNVQTIGFRYKDGKDYAFLSDDNNFLNDNVSGILKSKQSIGSSKLKSYSAGFTPGMEKWRGKGGWYTNVGQDLPDIVYGAKDGYLYNKQGQQIGFNANGTYYLKNNIIASEEKPTFKNTLVNGWSGLVQDFSNLSSRFDPSNNQGFQNRFTGIFGDLGRGIQHAAQGTVGALATAIIPDSLNETIGKYGQITDIGKDLRSITSLFGNGKFVTPWDQDNHGLVDYADIIGNKQGLQDINDALNGATVLIGTKGLGTTKEVLKGTLQGTKAMRFTEAALKGAKNTSKNIKNIYSNGAYYTGKAGLRPSNITPMINAVKQGFKNARTYYEESAPVVTKPTIVESKPVTAGTKQYIQPTIKKLNPNKGAEVVYNMKFNPVQEAQNIMAKPKFIFKENSIVHVPKGLPVKVEQPVLTQQPVVKPSVQKIPKTAPKQLTLEFVEDKPKYVQPILKQLNDAKKAEIASKIVPIDYANVAHTIMQSKPTIQLPEFRFSSKFNPISEAKARTVSNTSNVGNIPNKNIKYVESQPTVNNSKILQWKQAKEIKAVPKTMKPKSKILKKVNKKYLGGILNNKFNNWINANN